MLRAAHSPLLRADRVACSIQEHPTAPRRQRAALRRAPRGDLRFCAGLRKALGYGWAQCIKECDLCYLLALPQCEAAHGESHIRTSDAVAAASMQNIKLNYDDAMVHTARDSPEHRQITKRGRPARGL